MAYLSVPKISRHLTFLHLSSPLIVDNCSHIANLSFAITYCSVLQKGEVMAGELKPKSFRIDDITADKFKEISADIGGNQQETLSKLIEAYEFQAGKAILTDKKSDIELFEKYVNSLTRMYMGSLEDNQTEKEATDEANSLYGINEELQRKIELLKKESDAKISNLNIMLSDKDKLNQALATSYDELKIKLESMMDEHKNFSILSGKYETLKKENEGLRKETDKAASIIEDMKSHEAEAVEHCKERMQIQQDKSLLNVEKENQKTIQSLKTKYQSEIDKYQQKYYEILENLRSTQAALTAAQTAESPENKTASS